MRIANIRASTSFYAEPFASMKQEVYCYGARDRKVIKSSP